MALYKNVQELVGGTPLMELSHFSLPDGVRLFAKLEYFNPGGSIKDRLGINLIQTAIASGELKPGGTIIEPTAGNTGIGIAIAAVNQGFRVIFVVPEHFSHEKLLLMRALGAEIVHTPKSAGMRGAIERTKELLAEIPGSYAAQQFENQANPDTYYKTIAPEIEKDLDGNMSVFVAGAGTGGTFMGAARYFKDQNPDTKTVIVEPEGSVIAGGQAGSHRTEGIGMEFLPDYMDRQLFDEIYTVKDDAVFDMVKQLARKEGLLVGSSSGAAMVAALKEAEKAKPGSNIVTIFPDSSERYLSKDIYTFDD
ncbi:cysteine synthase family protein [Gracilibacillus caseinilyticus]|uniref:Cysteine synthase family protein n=1 Tax=Gracilibacillus caseinilyticus TaxID=2932256 RepID=A0ABY4EQN0_9BACI|nr:cysteine synthase family protein [Gracilibacillus caseinilyticus]UOQ46750.1 cysteine synthase family protein [Gracilibacillus caseinilyticus]